MKTIRFLFLLAVPALLLLGCGDGLVTSPESAVLNSEPAADKAVHDTVPVRKTSDGSVVGTSSLVRHGNSLSVQIKTSEIPAGMAVTVWWVVFNRPDYCNHPTPHGMCGLPDLFDPMTMSDLLYATGHVTGNDGKIHFGAQQQAGDTSDSIRGFYNALRGENLPVVGLQNVEGAEVRMVIRTHRQALPEYMPDMTSTFNGGCKYPPGVPEEYGAAGPNMCSNIQVAVHAP